MLIKRILQNRSQIFLHWLVSYVSILLVPLAASVILYFVSVEVIEGEINKANQASMKQLGQLVDDQLTGLRKIAIDIGWDKQVMNVAYARQPLDMNHRTAIVNVIENLKVQSTSNRLIDFVYIYFKNSSIVLSGNAMNEVNEFYDFYHNSTNFSYEEWSGIINSIHPWDYASVSRKGGSDQILDSVAFMQTIPVEYPKIPLGTIVFMVDRINLSGILKEAEWMDESINFILDKDNNVLASSGSVKLPESLTYSSMEIPGQYTRHHIGNEDVVITFQNSSALNWKYVTIIPERVFLAKVRYVGKIILMAFMFCMVLGGAGAWLYTKRDYNQVKRILKTISNNAGLNFATNANEYDFINKSFEMTINENRKINQKLKSQYGILQTSFISRLLKGTAGRNITFEEITSSYGISFYSPYFAVMLMVVEDYSGFFPKETEKVPGESLKLARCVIGNIVQELVEQHNKAFIIEEDDAVICLVNFKSTDVNFGVEALQQVAEAAGTIIRKEFRIHYTSAISTVHETLYGIQRAYQETLEVMDYRLVVGTGDIIKYDSVKEAEKVECDYAFTMELQQRFINCIKAGEMDKAAGIMEKVIDQSFSQAMIPVAMARCIMFAMVNTMINAVKEISNVLDKDFIDSLRPLERLLKLKTVVEMKVEMKSILTSIGEYIQVSKVEKLNNLIPDIKDYIRNNYHDSNLSLTSIAGQLDMNATYISRYFKEHTGEGLLDYISKVRITRAKELLKSKDISIMEISERVGFYNNNTFIRVFKKYEGITPGKFKELL